MNILTSNELDNQRQRDSILCRSDTLFFHLCALGLKSPKVPAVHDFGQRWARPDQILVLGETNNNGVHK